MTSLLASGFLAAAAAITWLHLKRTSRGAARPFPSLQLLEDADSRRRPNLRIEDPMRWLLRTAVLALSAAALVAARTDDPRRGLAILVDPETGPAGLDLGRKILSGSPASARAVLLMFRNGVAAAEGGTAGTDRLAARRAKLSACGAAESACLWRAAYDEPSVVVLSPFRSPGWSEAIHALPRVFAYRRIAAAGVNAPAPPPRNRGLPACRVVRTDDAAESRIWEAALGAVTRRAESGECLLEVGLASLADEGSRGKAARLLLATSPGVASAAFPAVVASRSSAIAIADDLAPISGRRALALDASLALGADSRYEFVLPRILTRRKGAAPPVLTAASSAQDLGRWANNGSLASLARLVVAEACPGTPYPARITPLPTALGWTSLSTRGPEPVGFLDTPPGTYEREDHRLRFDRARDPDVSQPPLSDSELANLGGRNELPSNRAGGRSIVIFALLGIAALLRLADAPEKRSLLVVASYLAAAIILGGWILDLGIPTQKKPELAARTVGPFPPAEQAMLSDALRTAGIKLESDSAFDAGSIAIAGQESRKPIDALLFPENAPRLDLMAVDFPAELRLGEAGALRLIVRAEHASGRSLTACAVADSGAGSEATIRITGDPAVLPLSLTVTPASAGIWLGSVAVRLDGAPAADPDGAVFAVVARAKSRKFLVASTAPNWDARAAAGALAASGIEVSSLTELGKTAVVGRWAAPEDPALVLARPGALDGYDAVVLAGGAPLGAAAHAGLEEFVRRGGGLLLLNPVPGAPGLTAPRRGADDSANESPQPVVGAWNDREVEFAGFMPPRLDLAPGAEILARLSQRGGPTPTPWICGRGLGNGRVVEVLVPDLWRLAGPGSSQAGAYGSLIREISSWILAGRKSPYRIEVADDLASFVVVRGENRSRVDANDAGQIAGLSADVRDPLSAVPCLRAYERAMALRRGRVLVEASSVRELADVWKRIPRPDAVGRRLHARLDDRLAAIFLIVLPFEVFLRRRIRADRGSAPDPLPEPKA